MRAKDLSDRRLNYEVGELGDDAPMEPYALFDAWMSEAAAAQDAGVPIEATAMTLATSRRLRSGMWQPSARVVLLKEYSCEGFVFYTNYESQKAHDLGSNPQASLSFYWHPLQRQINIEGPVQRIEAAASAEYFDSRPVASKLGAWASPQSKPVTSREALDELYEQAAREHGADIAYPSHWGGYRLHPMRIEFWQGRPSRLHDRLQYSRVEGGWERRRLAP